MARPVRRLKGLRVHEASLVDRGANPGAAIVLWKSADRETAMVKSLAAELLSIAAEEPEADQAALYLEAIADFEQGLRPEQEEEIEVQTSTELSRMLSYARAGGQAHSWSDADVYEAMTSLAARLSPDLPAATALAKHFGDPDMRALYGLYRSAEAAAPEPEPVVKADQTTAERQIEALARALMQESPSYTLPRAISYIVSTPAGAALYTRHRDEVARRIAGAGSALVR